MGTRCVKYVEECGRFTGPQVFSLMVLTLGLPLPFGNYRP